MFGHSVAKLVEEAKPTKYKDSIVGKSTPTTPVFTYKAPSECGAGSIEIYLNGESALWSTTLFANRPQIDALIACNAGLATYREWIPVVQAAHQYEIPFGVTEYAEQSAEQQVQSFPVMLQGRFMRDDYPIDLNPFHSPGQRGLPMIRLPNLINGFTIVVVKKVKGAGIEKELNKLHISMQGGLEIESLD
jgi:hypothetical protein